MSSVPTISVQVELPVWLLVLTHAWWDREAAALARDLLLPVDFPHPRCYTLLELLADHPDAAMLDLVPDGHECRNLAEHVLGAVPIELCDEYPIEELIRELERARLPGALWRPPRSKRTAIAQLLGNGGAAA